MNKVLLVLMMSFGLTLVSGQAMAKNGADDPAGHVRQSRGADDPAGHVSGADHADGHVSGRDRVGGGRNDRTGDAPRINGEDGGPRQCRGCDPTSGRNR